MLSTAITLILLLGLAHSYLGERYILMRLFKRGDLPKVLGSAEFTAGTLRFVWHLITLVWWGIAVILLQVSGPTLDTTMVLRIFATVAFFSGLLPLFFTRGRHLSWIVFFAIAALLWLAAAKS